MAQDKIVGHEQSLSEADTVERNGVVAGGSVNAEKVLCARVIRKCCYYLLPWLWMLVFFTYLDRSNLAFAAFQFKKDIHLSNTVYGLGASIFFVGYTVGQIPSNLCLKWIGPSWLTIILVGWGIVSALGCLINSPDGYIVQRLILGIVESGTFPGMWYHITIFFNSNETGPALALVATSTALSQVIGAPIGAALMLMDGLRGIRGWRWLFLIEGLITIVFGIAFYFGLAQTPAKAYFLKREERVWLDNRQKREAQIRADANPHTSSMIGSFFNFRIWWLALAWLLEETVRYGILFWVPLLLDGILTGHFNGKSAVTSLPNPKDQAWYSAKLALISAILYVSAAIVMTLIAWSSKRHHEKNLHVAIPLVCSGIAFICTPIATEQRGTIAGFAVLCIAGACTWCTFGPAWSWPAEIFHGPARASGIALFNSCGAAGGIIGPYLIGYLSDHYSYGTAMTTLGAFNLAAALLFGTFPGASKADKEAALAAEQSTSISHPPAETRTGTEKPSQSA
ncbi:Putative tartrate transporter [Coccomyxa sp. Obi]|nr:Putative tartrate transporter [Coccomyxa sp. Obi]